MRTEVPVQWEKQVSAGFGELRGGVLLHYTEVIQRGEHLSADDDGPTQGGERGLGHDAAVKEPSADVVSDVVANAAVAACGGEDEDAVLLMQGEGDTIHPHLDGHPGSGVLHLLPERHEICIE